MANEGLKLLVTADVTQAEKALKDFTQTAQTQGAKAGSSFGKGLNDANGSLASLPKTAKPAIKAVADIGDAASNSIIELKQLKKSLQGELSGLSKNQLGGVGGLALKKELEGVNSELRTLEKQAGVSGRATTGAFQKGYGAIKQLANLLPGIGIAGILGLISAGIFKIGESLLSLDGKTSRLSDLRDSIAGAKDEFIKAATNVSELKEQIRLAKEGFIDKDKVVKIYNDTIGRTTGFVTSLDQAEQELNKNADNYIRFTLLKAAANVAAEKSAEKLFQAEQLRQKKAAEFRNGLTDARVGGGGLSLPGGGSFNAREYEKESQRIVKAQIDRQEAAVQAEVDAAKQFEDIQKSLNDQAKRFGFNLVPDEKLKEIKDNTKDVIAEAKRIADYFNDRSIRDVGIDFSPFKKDEAANKRKATEFIRAFQSDFRSAIREFGFDFNVRPEVSIDTDGAEFRKNVQTQGQKAINALQDEINKLKKSKIILEFELDIKTAEKRGIEFAEKLGVNFENLNSLLKNAQKKTIFFANAISNTLGGAFQSLTQAITAGENPIKAFFQSIGQSVLQLVQKLLQAAIQAAILNAIFGAAGFSAGGKTIKGFGGFFKNIVGFASGGIVSGPTLAMVGEGRGTSRSNPEIIAPLDQLRGMIQGINTGGQVSGRLSARVRGNDILLSNERTSRSNRRLGAR